MKTDALAATHTPEVPRDFTSDFVAAVDRQLTQLGMRRPLQAYRIWQRPIAPGVSEWVSLVPRFFGGGEGSLGVVVTVGARHEAVEGALRTLWPELADSTASTTKIGASIAINVQELIPEPVRGAIYVDGPQFLEPAALTVAERVRDYGEPFARSVVPLPALIDAWKIRGNPMATDYRLPIALYLDGRPDEAKEALASTLERLGTMSGPVREHFEAFARDFFARMATLPVQAE